ncbi:hypothetical protein ACHAXH_008431 [Discostella pseudostelligera]|jgi:hypothetical protein
MQSEVVASDLDITMAMGKASATSPRSVEGGVLLFHLGDDYDDDYESLVPLLLLRIEHHKQEMLTMLIDLRQEMSKLHSDLIHNYQLLSENSD